MPSRVSQLIRFTGIVLVGLALLSIVIWVPIEQASGLPKVERIKAETAARDVLVKAIGGSLVFITAFIGWKNLKATERSILVSEEKQIAERFSKAVEMLGHEENVHIRLGGIYALERIAMDSKKDHYPVMQVLAAFIRTKTSVVREQESDTKRQDLHEYDPYSLAREIYEQEQEECRSREPDYREDCELRLFESAVYYIGTLNERYVPNHLIDVQVAVSAIGRQNLDGNSSYSLDLSKTLLEGITFEGNYKNVSFYKTHFKDCIFGIQLGKESASFSGNNFSEAIFEKVKFNYCRFEHTDFINSVFISSTFKGTNFGVEVDMTETKFSGGTYIDECQFEKTILVGSSIGDEIKVPRTKTSSAQSAHFMARSEVRNTDFIKADLTEASLVNVLFSGGSCKKETSFNESKLSSVTFEDIELGDTDFTGARIGHLQEFHIGNGQYEWRACYQENYSNEVSFINAGIKRADLEEKAIIITEPNFN